MRNSRNVLAAAALSVLAGAGTAPASGANLVSNGGFEDVAGNTNPSFFLNNSSGALTGWTSFVGLGSISNNVLFGSPTETATRSDSAEFSFWPGVAVSPGKGKFVALDGDPTPGAQQALSQTISGLTMGETYTLTFDWAATQFEFVNGAGPPFNCSACWSGVTSNEIEVSLGGGVPQDTEILDKIPAKGFTGWKAETFNFTATATSEMLKFVSIGAPSGQPPVALLDDVSLTGDVGVSPTGAIPEPGTWAMMGIGFAALGLAAYRRRRKALAIG
jgi:hypothetical protein